MQTEKISLIIPTYNAENYLPTLLQNLKMQTILFELIIIDSSSTDNTVEIAKCYTKNILSIPTGEFDHGGTRTKAAKTATGDILVFLTQDALPYDSHAIENIIIPFENEDVAAVYGRQLAYEKTSSFGKHLRLFNYPTYSHHRTIKDKDRYGIKTAFLSDSFAAYRKTDLERISWFKDGLIVGEDNYAGAKFILCNRTLVYNADAKVYHSHSYTIFEEFTRYFDIGVFHKNESWILRNFGKVEGEGGKYLKSELNYLLRHHKYYSIPEFILRNGIKYLGYKLGKNYKRIPLNLIKKLSLHKSWWENR